MAYYHLCLFLFLSLLFGVTQQQPQAAPPPHSYVFAVQWPNSYCNAPPRASRPCAHPIPQRFTIHGLWPNNAAGKPMPPWPGAAVLNSAAVSQYTFLADLVMHWPDLNGNHFMFWKHEWDTHGSGSGETPENFFLKAIDLIKEINGRMDASIVIRFIRETLNPGPGKVYKPTEFPSVVYKFTHVVAKISCNFDTAQKNQLHEIHFCLDRLGILINCTHQVVQQKIVYPTKGCNPTSIAFP